MNERDRDPGTVAVHAGDEPDEATSALEPPLVMSSAYAFPDAAHTAAVFAGEEEGFVYTRWRNPTVEAFERKIAALEGAEAAVALGSGMAAVHGAMTVDLRAGDHVVASASVYAETAKLIRERLARFAVEVTHVDTSDLVAVEEAFRPTTRVVWIETPANPVLTVTDIARAAEIAHARGASLCVDSTFATPYHQRPLSLGADLVVHSATKAICGHGDAIGGVVAGSAELCARVRSDAVRASGAAMSPFTAWVLARGARTLPLRAERASATAMELARRLEADRRIERVFYPGLPSHPQHEVAARQMQRGFGAIVAFEVRGGVAAGQQVYDRVELVARAVSLGDVRSLLTHPASTTQASMPADQRRAAGISDGLMRLSVGIEGVEDLWSDLDRALR